jgi:hypothetical protein
MDVSISLARPSSNGGNRTAGNQIESEFLFHQLTKRGTEQIIQQIQESASEFEAVKRMASGSRDLRQVPQ